MERLFYISGHTSNKTKERQSADKPGSVRAQRVSAIYPGLLSPTGSIVLPSDE